MLTYKRKTTDIFISDELRNILKEIESASKVASLLLKKRHYIEDLVDSPVNYISVSHDDKTKISYLTLDRIKSLDVDTYWTSNSRYKGKAGAFVNKLFKNIPTKEVENFSNLFRAQSLKESFTFKVVDADDIKKYYHHSSYLMNSDESVSGSLGASCMKHDSCQKVLKLYTKNTSQVKMLVMLDKNEKLIGRALLWTFNDLKIMDRIYSIADEDYFFHFKKWATKNNYLYKSEQNWNSTLFFENFNTERKELYLEFDLVYNPKKYPYMDTFKFINPISGRLFNFIPENTNIVTLTCVDGDSHPHNHLRFDGIYKLFRNRGDVNWLSYLNIYVYHRDCNYSSVNDSYILKKDSQYDDELDDYIYKNSFSHLNSERCEQIRKQRKEKIITLKNTNSSLADFYYQLNSITSSSIINEDLPLVEEITPF